MHLLGCLLGLPGQLVEFGQRVLGGIGVDARNDDGSTDRNGRHCRDQRSPKKAIYPLHAIETQGFRILLVPRPKAIAAQVSDRLRNGIGDVQQDRDFKKQS
jgi:hypothetical protein